MTIYQLEIVPDEEEEGRVTMGIFSSLKLALRHALELWRSKRILDRVDSDIVEDPSGPYRRTDLQISWYTVDVPEFDEDFGWLGYRNDDFFLIPGGHR